MEIRMIASGDYCYSGIAEEAGVACVATGDVHRPIGVKNL